MSEEVGYSHLDFEKRCIIEKYLNAGMNMSWIARQLGLPVSTVSREVKRNRRDDGHTKHKKTTHVCRHRRNCMVRSLCKDRHCRRRRCNSCDVVLCTNLCQHYEPEVCSRTSRAPYVCNGCVASAGCVLHRYRYEARCAQRMAECRLKETRGGINCTEEEFEAIIGIVRPLLQQRIGLDAIWCAHKDELGISKRTFYRWADLGLGVCNMDLPKKVSYRPRKKNRAEATPRPDLTGRTYADFARLSEEVRTSAWEIDCIEGLRTDRKVILTLLHKRTHFQFGVLLEEHTSACVVAAINWVESICEGRFKKLFPILVCDRGHEFSDIGGMEKGAGGKKRCSVYVCDPQRPDQRGQGERAHIEIRKVLPKRRTSLDALSPWDIATVFSHVNSVPKPSLGGMSPLALAMAIFPKSLFEELGLVLVPLKMIILKPELLDNSDKEDSES
jgi:IS30 family transposase